MRVAIKDPGEDWMWIDIDPTLEQLQKLVGGHIECAPQVTNAIIYCNEDGLELDLMPNVEIYEGIEDDDDFLMLLVGPIVMMGPVDDNGNETELTRELFDETLDYMEDNT